MTAILTASDLVKTYHLGGRDVPALRGLSMRIDDPGFYAVMGPSGSGKSTLLHLLAGLDRPDSGTIEVTGQRVDELGERGLTAYRRRRIGIVFQSYNLIPTLTAIDNITLPAMLDGVDRAEREARAHALLDRLGLEGRDRHRPDALSGGEQQRVAIARALMFRPPLLFADEPTGNLDSASSLALWTLLRDLADQDGLSVVMVTHEPAAATECRRVFMLRDGLISDAFDVEGLDVAELATRAQPADR